MGRAQGWHFTAAGIATTEAGVQWHEAGAAFRIRSLSADIHTIWSALFRLLQRERRWACRRGRAYGPGKSRLSKGNQDKKGEKCFHDLSNVCRPGWLHGSENY